MCVSCVIGRKDQCPRNDVHIIIEKSYTKYTKYIKNRAVELTRVRVIELIAIKKINAVKKINAHT